MLCSERDRWKATPHGGFRLRAVDPGPKPRTHGRKTTRLKNSGGNSGPSQNPSPVGVKKGSGRKRGEGWFGSRRTSGSPNPLIPMIASPLEIRIHGRVPR